MSGHDLTALIIPENSQAPLDHHVNERVIRTTRDGDVYLCRPHMRLYRVRDPGTVEMFKRRDKVRRDQLRKHEMAAAAKILDLARKSENGTRYDFREHPAPPGAHHGFYRAICTGIIGMAGRFHLEAARDVRVNLEADMDLGEGRELVKELPDGLLEELLVEKPCLVQAIPELAEDCTVKVIYHVEGDRWRGLGETLTEAGYVES